MQLEINFKIFDRSFHDFSKEIFSIEPVKINYNRENLEKRIKFLAEKNKLKHNDNHLFFTFTQNEENVYFELNIDLYKEEEAKLSKVDNFIYDIIFDLIEDLGLILENRDCTISYIDTIINLNYSNATFYNQYKSCLELDNNELILELVDGFGKVKNKLISYEKFLKRRKKCLH
jgi:hypothetical protein